MASAACAAGPGTITINGVYLKDGAGKWVKVIEPDRIVDFSKEEATVVFFNNHGRVPAGAYKNFRIDFTGNEGARKLLSSRRDFDKGVAVKKGSFIRVSFDLAFEKEIEIRQADMTVDADSRTFSSDDLILEA